MNWNREYAAKKCAQPSKKQSVVRRLIRSQTQTDLEGRQVPQYASGMALDNSIDYTQIPDTMTKPNLQNLKDVQPEQIILFDVETNETGRKGC